MSYKIKIPSKHTPLDEAQFLSRMERFWLTAEEYRRGIVVGLFVVCAAIGIVAWIVWYDMQQNQEALTLHEDATRFFNVRPSDKPEQADKNLKKAISLYQKVVQDYPRSSIAPQSLYGLGIAFAQGNRLPEALESYQKYVSQYRGNESMVALAYQRMAYAWLLEGNRDKAEKAFTSVLSLPGALNKDQALYELGKLEEAQSRPEGALARYQDLLDHYPRSPMAGEARVRIKALSVDGKGKGASPGEKEDPTEDSAEEKETAESPSTPE